MNGNYSKQPRAPRQSLNLHDGDHCIARLDFPLPKPPSVEDLARQRLTDGCPYGYYFKRVTVQFRNGTLTLRGCVPTFYLKQMLQTWLKGLDGVLEIDNQVEVVSATALSSHAR